MYYGSIRRNCIYISLLDYMGQFMGQQMLPLRRSRPILPCPKHNVLANSKSPSANSTGGFVVVSIGMNSHLRKINAKSRFEKVAFRLRQWLTTALESGNVMLEVERHDRLGP